MACTPSPTATLFGSSTSESESTSFSKSVSSLPDSVTTLQSTTCVATTTGADNSTSCAETSTIDQVKTIPGGQTTVQVPVVITVPIIQTFPTQTIFSSCNGDTTTTPTTTSSTSTSTSTPPRTSTIVTVTTPPPIVKTIQAPTTLPNGSKTQTTVLVTSIVSPSTVHEATTVSYQQVQSSDGASHSRVKVAPIVGGAVGGFFALLFLVAVVWLILRKRGSWDDIFDKDTDGPIDFHPSRLVRSPDTRMSLDMRSEMEPKPYQYGLVGPSGTPPFASPPGSPTDYYYPQHVVPDNGRAHAQNHSRNRSFSPDNNQYMHDNRRSFSPEYNQHTRQYSADHIVTQHNRRPSSTSLLYTPLQLPTTAISPEPSMASVYSQATSRPGYDRDNSSGSGSRPPTGNSRHSAEGSVVSRSSTRNSNSGPAGPRRLRRPSRPDDSGPKMPPTAEHGARPLSSDSQGGQGRHQRPSNDTPVSPRMLTLTNWNPSTDAISFDAAAQPSRMSREQPHGQQNNRSSVLSTGANTSPRAGPSTSANVIIHTDGGAVGGDTHATNDVKEMPTEEPPAYSG